MIILREAVAYSTIILVLCGLIYSEGQKSVALQSQIALPVQELYKKLSRSQIKLQILDARQNLSDYEDTHVPGSVPFPNCEFDKLPSEVAEQIFFYMPTVIVSENGDPEVFSRCKSYFKTVQNLQGGITAWVDNNLPEDSGEYYPPRLKAGGGCL
jgi:rhodanese-related sulfurtransferase